MKSVWKGIRVLSSPAGRWPSAFVLAALLGLVAGPPGAAAQETPGEAEESPLFVGYDPSPAYPFGRPNPDAPPELAQFSFMVGEFDCVDGLRQQDGTMRHFNAIWNARYFLNGMGIQDEYWSPTFATSNIRIFDPQEGKWKVTFFRMPGYSSGVWEGGLEDGDMVLARDGSQGHLRFHEITNDGFKWRTSSRNWTSVCTRRR